MANTFHYLLNFLIAKFTAINTQVALAALVLLSMLIVLDRIISSLKSKKRETGLDTTNDVISIDGSKTVPAKEYISDIQGLAGRPDAVISENGYLIPVERKPLARKLRDRYVAQLLVYMRLIEEFEGKKPPYGYLILGGNCRRIKIENTAQRQAWLQAIIDDMRGILAGTPAVPTPMFKKCNKCDVREACSFRADVKIQTPKSELVMITGGVRKVG